MTVVVLIILLIVVTTPCNLSAFGREYFDSMVVLGVAGANEDE